MKLEIVKETKINGNVFYSIELDGNYITNSINMDLEKVQSLYDEMVKNGSVNLETKEVIQSTEI